MRKTVMFAVTALALWTAPAAAQHVHGRWESIHDGARRSMDVDGEVRFSDDDARLVWLSPGGRVVIEEEVPGQPARRVEYRGTGDGVETRFFRGGRETEPDGADRAWIGRMMVEWARESGANAERRVERLYARGGADAVLEDAARISSDGVKRTYYTLLLRRPLRPDEAARALREAGARIASDGDRRAVLMAVMDRGDPDPRVLAALLQADARIASDGDKSSILVAAAERDALDDPAVSDAFFRAAGRIASDGDKARVLTTVLARREVRREVVVDALRTAATLASDGDRGRVLTSVPEAALDDRAVRGAFMDAVRGIASDGERSRVLQWAAGRTR